MEDNKISVNALSLVGRALMHLGDTLAAEPYLNDASDRFERFHVAWHDNVINMYVFRARAARYHGLDSARAILNTALQRASLAKSCQNIECIVDSSFVASHVLGLFKEQIDLSSLMYSDDIDRRAAEIDQWISHYESMASRYLGQTRSDAGIRLVADANKDIYDTGILAHLACWHKDREARRVEKMLEYLTKEKALSLRLNANNRNIQQYANLAEDILVREKQLLGAVSMRRQQMLQDSSPESQTQYSNALEAYSSFKTELKRTHPQYYALKYDLSVPTLSEIQQRLQTGERYLEFGFVDTLLLAIAIGPDVTKVYSFDTARVRSIITEYIASVLSRDQERHRKASERIYEELLRTLLESDDTRQLIIGPDDILYHMSFESVRVPETDRYLIQDYTVYYAPSVDAWAETTSGGTGYKSTILDLTPGFGQDIKDDYLRRTDTTGVDSTYITLLSQPFMMDLSLLLDKTYGGTSLRGSQATESAFKSWAGSFQLIHFGTHAQMDDQNPLFSRLILTKEENGEDGYLHTYEIYGTPLEARLSVLTACETGRGAFEAGQGIQSLAHAFAYAGCPSMIMSLWSIDEETSALLTELFYKNLKEGMTLSVALAEAKREFLVIADEDLRHPFYWSGLVLMGSDGDVKIRNSYSVWLWTIGIIIMAALGGIAYKIYSGQRTESQ